MGLIRITKAVKITSITLSVLMMLLLFNACIPENRHTIRKEYMNKMITLLNEKSKIKVSDVFEFEFDRAYVFDDCYVSGEGFAEHFDLDISIEEVESGAQEYNHRIVFVDEQGEFVYEFLYESYILNPYEEGMIIYPDTELELCERQGTVLCPEQKNIHRHRTVPCLSLCT